MRTPDIGDINRARRYVNLIQRARWEQQDDFADDCLREVYYMLDDKVKNALDYLCRIGEIE